MYYLFVTDLNAAKIRLVEKSLPLTSDSDVKNLAEGRDKRDGSQFKFIILKTSDAHDL